jgi:hypothetical protein
MLQVVRPPVRFPMKSLDAFNLPNLSSRTKALELAQPLTEICDLNLPGRKARPGRKPKNLSAICDPTV